jgi:hypothetical protein
MKQIAIQAIPNQLFNTQVDGNNWLISIRLTDGVMVFSFTKNGTLVIDNVRSKGNDVIIPYRYLEDGNFALVTQDQELPLYSKFGISQYLLYASQIEIDAARQKSGSIIKSSDFNPIASLPLRFKPQGYKLA